MNYNWDDARLFLAVARAGKINLAAEKLNLTPLTVSRRIAALESKLQALLFVRHRLGVDLTGEGQEFYEIFERAEREMLLASAKAGTEDIGIGHVRIAAPDGFTDWFCRNALAGLSEKLPDMSLDFVPLSRSFSLSKREADIAVIVGKPKAERLHAEPLATYHLRLAAARSYLQARGTPTTLDELRDHDLIGYVDDLLISPELNYARELWRFWENKISIHNPIGQFEAMRAGIGIAVVHDFLFEDDDEIICLLPEHKITRQYWLVTHENIRNLPRIRAVMRYMKQASKQISEL